MSEQAAVRKSLVPRAGPNKVRITRNGVSRPGAKKARVVSQEPTAATVDASDTAAAIIGKDDADSLARVLENNEMMPDFAYEERHELDDFY